MTVLVVSNFLGGVVDFTTTEELLGVAGGVKDDTEGSSHVSGLLVGVPVGVLTGVSASVTVDVLELVGLVGLGVVDGVVALGLDDLSDPGADGHELLALAGVLDFKEVIFGAVGLVHFASVGVAGFLVVDASLLIGVLEVGFVVLESLGRLKQENQVSNGRGDANSFCNLR